MLRPRKLMLSGGPGCYPITLSPLISPRLWESRLTQLKVLRRPRPFRYCNAAGCSTPLAFIRFLTKICEPLLALLSLATAVLFHTRQGFASLATWISHSPSVRRSMSSRNCPFFILWWKWASIANYSWFSVPKHKISTFIWSSAEIVIAREKPCFFSQGSTFLWVQSRLQIPGETHCLPLSGHTSSLFRLLNSIIPSKSFTDNLKSVLCFWGHFFNEFFYFLCL